MGVWNPLNHREGIVHTLKKEEGSEGPNHSPEMQDHTLDEGSWSSYQRRPKPEGSCPETQPLVGRALLYSIYHDSPVLPALGPGAGSQGNRGGTARLCRHCVLMATHSGRGHFIICISLAKAAAWRSGPQPSPAEGGFTQLAQGWAWWQI